MHTIICHPDTWSKMKNTIAAASGSGYRLDQTFKLKLNKFMEKDRPTGKYVLPNGSLVEKDQVCVHTRFIDYGPEDLEWLLYAGVVAEDRAPVYWVVDLDKLDDDYLAVQPMMKYYE